MAQVIIADGENNEDVVIKISDEGGGIKRSHMPRIWTHPADALSFEWRRRI